MLDGKKPLVTAKLAAQVVAYLAAAEGSIQSIRPGYFPRWWAGTLQVCWARRVCWGDSGIWPESVGEFLRIWIAAAQAKTKYFQTATQYYYAHGAVAEQKVSHVLPRRMVRTFANAAAPVCVIAHMPLVRRGGRPYA